MASEVILSLMEDQANYPVGAPMHILSIIGKGQVDVLTNIEFTGVLGPRAVNTLETLQLKDKGIR